MKKVFLCIVALFSIALFAQEAEDMSKYMVGAIPLKEGKVVFEKEIKAPSLSIDHVYRTAYLWLEDHLDDEEVKNPQIFENKDAKDVWWMASMPEHFLVFKKTMLSVDRSFIKYRIRLTASEENLKMEIWDITYEYYPGATKEPERYTAEKCITDEYALDKSRTKLNRLTSKFRIKTIDMVDEYAKELELLLNAEVVKVADAVKRADKSDRPQMISYERHTPTPMTSTASTPTPAAKQPTMAELQSQMVAQKKTAATPVVSTAAPVEKAAVVPAPTPEKVATPAPVAQSSTELPSDIVNLIQNGGMVVAASSRVANVQWGGAAYLNGMTVITLYVPKSRPAHNMLSADDKFTITVGGVKYHVIECRKLSETAMDGNMTMFIGEVVKVESK